jgi:hypothetical protein
VGSNNSIRAIFVLLSLPSSGAQKLANWGIGLFRIAVYGFLALETKWSPGYSGQPLRVDLLIAPLARPKSAFLNPAERRACISKLVKFAVEMTNREYPF